jgi:hypothetical protein
MANQKVLAWVHFQRAPSDLYMATATAGGEKEMLSQSSGASIGDVAGQVISGIDVQVIDGGVLTYAQITASDGGQVINMKGGERLAAGGSVPSSNLNMCAQGLSILVERGQTFNVMTAD